MTDTYKFEHISFPSIPQYGGEERPYGNYPTINAALAIGKTWT